MKGNTASIMEMMSRYSTAPVEKAAATKENRIEVGQVFLQPTGGKGTKPLNYAYGYWGFKGANGFIGGFSLPNAKVLEMASSGIFSDSMMTDITDCFTQYADKFVADGHVVLK